ncbi:MAG: hypothetical protein ACFFED_02435 [Candidatus Thorarchaeota archaeon]
MGKPRCTEMKVESIDFLKSYSKAEHYLQTLVRIVDRCSTPIEHARVRIRIQDPDGESVSLSTLTNRDGFAAIEISGTLGGAWEVDVKDVYHPNYTLMQKNSLVPTRSTHI